MKKKIIMLLVFTLMITMTGCGKKKSDIEILSEAYTGSTKIDSFNAEFAIDSKVKKDGVSVEMPVNLSIQFAKKNDVNNIKLSISDNPIIGAQEMYVSADSKLKGTLYMQSTLLLSLMKMFDDTPITMDEVYWITQSLESEEDFEEPTEPEEEINLDTFKNLDMKKIITEDDYKLIKKDGDVSHYKLTITKALLDRLTTELKEDAIDFEGTLEIDIHINTKDNVITKISMDLLTFMKSIAKDDSEDGELSLVDIDMIEKLSVSYELKAYNNVTVEIPTSVTSKALTTEEFNQKLMEEMGY